MNSIVCTINFITTKPMSIAYFGFVIPFLDVSTLLLLSRGAFPSLVPLRDFRHVAGFRPHDFEGGENHFLRFRS